MSSIIDVKAPAKLNLFLHITGRRKDGYHLLQSLFVPVALYDSLSFQQNSLGLVRRLSVIEGISEDDDLVVRAARLLKEYVSRPELGVDIELHKVIPSGAGLGGGSSDAASTLVALNDLWGLCLSIDELLPLALRLGADVPFFLDAEPAIVEGIGECITKLSSTELNTRLSKAHYVLFVPKLPIPTPSIFKDPSLKRDSDKLGVTELELALEHAEQPWLYGHNDLEPVARAQHPALEAMCQFLFGLGIKARMSGAGSVFFAAYESHAEAEAVRQRVEAELQALASYDGNSDNLLNSLQLRCLIAAANSM